MAEQEIRDEAPMMGTAAVRAEAGKTRVTEPMILAALRAFRATDKDSYVGKMQAALEASLALVPAGGETEARLADLGRLLVALGMGDHARPQSPAEVFEACLARAAALAGSVVEPGGMRDALTKSQRFVLEWLAKEDFSSLGECQGPDLDALVDAGLAAIGNRGVSVTEAGFAALAAAPAPPALVPQQPAVVEIGRLHNLLRSIKSDGHLQPYLSAAIDAALASWPPATALAAPPSSERAGLEPKVAAPVAAGRVRLADAQQAVAFANDAAARMILGDPRLGVTFPATPPARSGLDPLVLADAAGIIDAEAYADMARGSRIRADRLLAIAASLRSYADTPRSGLDPATIKAADRVLKLVDWMDPAFPARFEPGAWDAYVADVKLIARALAQEGS